MKNNMIKNSRMPLLLFMFYMIFYPVGTTQAASVIADTPCDSLYYESLSARAWLEAQREITQNQNLILKPDSVFEYTCFDQLVNELADHGDELLSETNNFGVALGANSLDIALNNLIGTSLNAYIGNNFGGGTYNLLAGHPAAAGISHNPGTISGGTYSCNIMSRVWQAAKCMNFASNSETDGFFTLAEYATNVDKRHLPTVCAPVTTSWTTNLTTALTSGPWTNDPVQTYQTLTAAQDCTGGGACPCDGDPIPTGVRVIRSGYDNNDYDENICLQPGCRYHPGGALNIGGAAAAEGCYGR